MSCGGNHDVECEQILKRVHWFIDNELESADATQIQQHLEECAPCLDEVSLDRLVKVLISRSCKESAPVELRQRIVFTIRQVHLELIQPRSEAD
jgi:mycothiol system anti-sigma-R factor